MTTICFTTTNSAAKSIIANKTVVNKDAFEKLNWVLRARTSEKDEAERFWQARLLHTRDNYIFCTDTFRIHKLNYSPSFFFLDSDSFYTVVKQTSNIIVLEKHNAILDKKDFDVEKYFSDDYEEVFELNDLYYSEVSFVCKTMFGFAFHIQKMFNPKYFYDAYIYSNKKWVGKVKFFDKPARHAYCWLSSGEFEAIIVSMCQ